MRNKLAIAVANIEAFIDGKLEPTPARLDAVLEALYQVDVLIGDMRGDASATLPASPRATDLHE